MNDDLISRQAVIDALDEICERECEYSKPQRAVMCGACRLGSAFDVVDELPSAQPEIIRCKNCKWYGRADKRRFYRGMDCLQKRIDTIIPDDDYCSRAERRTAEHI